MIIIPNRIIKESICVSDSIDQLTWFEEVLFYRLIVNCDDFGRFDGRAAVIKNKLFTLKNNVTEKAVLDAINKLSTVGLVIPYTWDGKSTLQLATWDKHQQVRCKRSKYPAYDGSDELSATDNVHLLTFAGENKNLISIDINGNQMNTNVPVIQYNPIQSEYNPNPNTNPNAHDAPDGFSPTRTKKQKDVEKDVDPFVSFSNNAELQKALSDFNDMRNKTKDPMTQRAKELLLTELKKLSTNTEMQIAIVNQAVLRNWKSVYPLKEPLKQEDEDDQYSGTNLEKLFALAAKKGLEPDKPKDKGG